MNAPVSIPADPPPVSLVWLAVSAVRFLRRVLWAREGERAVASAPRDDEDTSLTQAELEILK